MSASPQPEAATGPNLYLVGMMGTGKSSVGRQVAYRLGMRFIDSDQAIEEAEGRAVREIFEQEGEAAFRAMERAFIEGGHPERGCVVACGGCLVVPEGMLELVRSKGVVVALFAGEQTILTRTSYSSNRPLLDGDAEERIRAILAERLPIYKRAGHGVCTENRPKGEVIDNVIRVYREEAGR